MTFCGSCSLKCVASGCECVCHELKGEGKKSVPKPTLSSRVLFLE